MNKPTIILIGGGGHCKSCIDVIEHEDKFSIAGIIDVKEKIGQTVLGYPIIGSDEDLNEIAKKSDNFLITIGQLKSTTLRMKLFEKIKKLGKNLPIIISPSAYVSKHTRIGEGTIIMNGAILNASSTVGKNCIINTNALIEHDTTIENHCTFLHLQPLMENVRLEIMFLLDQKLCWFKKLKLKKILLLVQALW
ncbi:MAG: acetyltransferase [Flavobacteriales bacterium]|nr:acetyltransferase [Flavobacteriales bacterium]